MLVRQPEHIPPSATRALWGLVAGLIGLYVLVFAICAATRLARPLEELVYGESWLLDGARRVARGEGLYGPADRLPLMHIAYMPTYYLLLGGLQRAFGDSGYTLGRAVSLVSSLLAAGLLAGSVRALTARWSIGLLAAGLFLTQNLTVLLWSTLYRADALALAWTIGGLVLATLRRPYLAVVPLLLALFTKQTFVAAPLAVCLALWPCRGQMVRFAGLYLGSAAVLIGIAEWRTDGWFLWHIVAANTNEADLSTFATLLGSFLQFNGLPLLAALASMAVPGKGPREERIWRLYFLASLLTLPTIAKLGASSNYWLELTAAMAVLLALAAHRLSSIHAARALAPLVIAGALLIGLPAYQATAMEASGAIENQLLPQSPRYLSLVADTGLAPYRVDARFVAEVAREPGELLTDNAGLAVAAGKPIAFEFQIFQLLQVEGHWSERPILDAIAAKRFSLVALMHPLAGPNTNTRLTPAVHDALAAAYAESAQQAGFWLYRPR